MLEKTGGKAMEALGGKAMGSIREGLDGIRDGGSRLAAKVGMRKTGMAALRSRMPGMTWSAAAVGIAALAAGLWFYLRKRRQVADHYTMGEGQAPWEGEGVLDFESAGAGRS